MPNINFNKYSIFSTIRVNYLQVKIQPLSPLARLEPTASDSDSVVLKEDLLQVIAIWGRTGSFFMAQIGLEMTKKTLILDIEEIKTLSNYCHWIPVIHGYTEQYMKDKYPGWSWNDLIPKMLKLGFITLKPSGNDVKLLQGLWLKAGISSITVVKDGRAVRFEAKREAHV